MSSGLPSMTALLGMLALAGYQNRDKISDMLQGHGSSSPAGGTTQPGLGGVLGGLGGMLGAGSAGSLLNSGIGELLNKFTHNGHGETANSWVSNGANKEISPTDVKQAIGPDVLATLEQQTGLTQEELLARLSRELPDAVDRYTPDGRIPHVS